MISFIKRKGSEFSYPHIPCGLCFKFLTLTPYLYYAHSEKDESNGREVILSTHCGDIDAQIRFVFLVLAEDGVIYYLDIDSSCYKLLEEFLFINAKSHSNHYACPNLQSFIESFLKQKTFCASYISINNHWPHFYISQITNRKVRIKTIPFTNTIDKYANEELMAFTKGQLGNDKL